jgi:hypothetical protein
MLSTVLQEMIMDVQLPVLKVNSGRSPAVTMSNYGATFTEIHRHKLNGRSDAVRFRQMPSLKMEFCEFVVLAERTKDSMSVWLQTAQAAL